MARTSAIFTNIQIAALQQLAAVGNNLVVIKDNSGSVTGYKALTRTDQVVSSATPTPNADTTDVFLVTALAVGATFGIPTGTPVDGQRLIIRIKDNGSAQTLAFTSGAGGYRASPSPALPTTTTISKTMYLGFIFNAADNRWDLVALLNNM